MPLQKNTLSISFAGGLDTKTDPKQVIPGKLLTLENGIFQTPKEIRKRNGYAALNQNIISGGSISAGVGLPTFKSELNELDGTSFYSYNESQLNWSNKGSATTLDLSVHPVIKNTYQQQTQDSAYHSSGLQCFVWEDSQGGIHYSVIDYITGDNIVQNAVVSSTANRPKVITFGTHFVIFYFDTLASQITYKTILVTSPTTLSGGTLLTTDAFGTIVYDAAIIGANLYVAYRNNALGLSAIYLNPALAASAEYIVPGTSDPSDAISVFGDAATNVWIGYSGPTILYGTIVNNTLTAQLLPQTVVDGSVIARNVTGIVTGTTATFYYESVNGPTYNTFVKSATLTFAGVAAGGSPFLRSVGLASKVFLYNGIYYFLAAFDSPLQARYFLINQSGQAVLKISAEPYLGGGLTKESILPEVNLISSGQYIISYLQKQNIGETSTFNAQGLPIPTSVTLTGVQQALINFNQTTFQTQEVGNNLHMNAGMLTMYDGGSVVEHGFDLYPEPVSVHIIPTGGALQKGSYQWSAVYEWTDNYGQIHRSAPSVAVTQNITNTFPLNVAGSYTMGTPTINNINTKGLYLGMLIAGTDIPMGTTIANVGSNTITISQNVTATSTEAQLTVTPVMPAIMTTDSTGNSAVINLADSNLQINGIPIYGSFASGSPIWTVYDNSVLTVGMVVNSSQGFLPANTRIVAINGNAITLSANATTTVTDAVSMVTIPFTGTLTSGNSTITGILPASVMNSFYIGQAIIPNNFTSFPVFITAIAGNTITVTANATTNGATAMFANVDPAKFLKPGQQLNGDNVLANTHIEAVTEVNGVVTVILDNETLPNALIGSYVTNLYEAIVTVPTLRVTNKKSPNSPVTIFNYRTEANGTLFYRTSSLTSPTYNDTTIDSVTFDDTTGDLVLIGNDQLYTNGGEVENIQAPHPIAMTVYRNRLIVVPAENPLTFWYSKQVIPGSPAEFSDVFIQNVDQKSNPLTAISALDDKLVLFTRNQVFYLVGDGPAPNGANNDFTNTQLITTDVGCVDPLSVVTIPSGLMFKSSKGIYLLDRSLGVSYIGADVEAYNSQTITSAKLIPNTNQVRLTLNSGIALVFDYFMNQWSVFTNISAVSSVIFQDLFTYVKSNGQVLQETPGAFLDNTAFIQLHLLTSWMSMAGFQGYERLYKALIVGDFKSAHNLVVKVAYDFNPAFTQTTTIPGSVPYQYRVFFARQKCEALQLDLSDSQVVPFGEGLSLSAIGLEVGVKTGLDKLPAVQSYG